MIHRTPDPRSALALSLVAALAGCARSSTSPKPAAPEPTVARAPAAPHVVTAKPPGPPAKDYPATRREDIVEQIHGVAVADPYRWLEDPRKPEVQAWMAAQNAYTRARLAKLPLRDALAARFSEVFYVDELTAPRRRAGRLFYKRKHKDKEKAILYWREGDAGAEHALLDPNTWSADGSTGLREWWPSGNGRYVAFQQNEHNADETTTYVIEVATGKRLDDAIVGTKYGELSWAADHRGFYYTWVPPVSEKVAVADRPGFAEVRYHALGTDPAKDKIVRASTKNPQTFVGAKASADGHWLIADVQHGWNSADVYFRDLRASRPTWSTLTAGVNANFEVVAYKDTFYVRTNDGAPRARVFAVDPKKPARANWREVVPQRDATLEEMTIVGGQLVLRYLHDAASELELRDLKGGMVAKIDVPALGSVEEVEGETSEPDAYVAYRSFTQPQTIYKISKTGKAEEWARTKLPIDTSQVVTEQVRYPSKDGTEITMFLVHKKDAVKNGQIPTFLSGYGGFNVSVQPGWSSPRSAWAAHQVWIEHGGMVAIANLRGGGEYGEDWHHAGMLLQKQNVYDDFIAAAKWLQASGWTSADRLAISGGSNGGLLVGAALTQAPAVFKAVVCEVPLLDMVRYHLFGSGATWVPEYGSAEDPAQFKALLAYSPYHRVAQGTSYPAVLFSSSDHDDRVDPMHARKLAASLQAATSSAAPIWLRIQTNAGHSGSDQVKLKIEQNADTYAFLMWQLGMQ